VDRPRFVVDGMLEKLGRYLRCAGWDALGDADLSTASRVELANRDGRVFLTRNRHLRHHHPLPLREQRIVAGDPVEQMREVLALWPLERELLFTRCVRCNVELDEIEREAARARVAPRVFERYRRFFRCPACATVFWKGPHVRNTCRKLGLPDVSECSSEGGC